MHNKKEDEFFTADPWQNAFVQILAIISTRKYKESTRTA